MNPDQEAQLVQKAKAGDREAFAQLYRFWVGKIYGFCMVRIGAKQDAEDVTEKVFIKALKSIHNFQQKSSFATWLYTIARNELTDLYRKRHLEPILMDPDELSQLPNREGEDPDDTQTKKRETIKTLLDKLPQNFRQILELRFLQNQSIQACADILDISETNVKVRTMRALEKAKELL